MRNTPTEALYLHNDTHLYFTKDGCAQNCFQVIVLENPRTIRGLGYPLLPTCHKWLTDTVLLPTNPREKIVVRCLHSGTRSTLLQSHLHTTQNDQKRPKGSWKEGITLSPLLAFPLCPVIYRILGAGSAWRMPWMRWGMTRHTVCPSGQWWHTESSSLCQYFLLLVRKPEESVLPLE